MQTKESDVYSIMSSPVADTLESGINNYVQVMINGKPDSVNWCKVSVTNASVYPFFYEGDYLKYIVTIDLPQANVADLWASRNGKIVVHKTFVIKSHEH